MSGAVEVAGLRRAAGLTQRELAELSGVAQANISAFERGSRNPSARMIARLQEAVRPRPSTVLAQHRGEVLRLARRHKASKVRIVGSIARGDDRPGSDVDLLVAFSSRASVFDQVELIEDLEELLGVRVDVISEAGLTAAHDALRSQARPL